MSSLGSFLEIVIFILCGYVIFVKHDLKGVLKYRGRNLDTSLPPTDVTDILARIHHKHH